MEGAPEPSLRVPCCLPWGSCPCSPGVFTSLGDGGLRDTGRGWGGKGLVAYGGSAG